MAEKLFLVCSFSMLIHQCPYHPFELSVAFVVIICLFPKSSPRFNVGFKQISPLCAYIELHSRCFRMFLHYYDNFPLIASRWELFAI